MYRESKTFVAGNLAHIKRDSYTRQTKKQINKQTENKYPQKILTLPLWTNCFHSLPFDACFATQLPRVLEHASSDWNSAVLAVPAGSLVSQNCGHMTVVIIRLVCISAIHYIRGVRRIESRQSYFGFSYSCHPTIPDSQIIETDRPGALGGCAHCDSFDSDQLQIVEV